MFPLSASPAATTTFPRGGRDSAHRQQQDRPCSCKKNGIGTNSDAGSLTAEHASDHYCLSLPLSGERRNRGFSSFLFESFPLLLSSPKERLSGLRPSCPTLPSTDDFRVLLSVPEERFRGLNDLYSPSDLNLPPSPAGLE